MKTLLSGLDKQSPTLVFMLSLLVLAMLVATSNLSGGNLLVETLFFLPIVLAGWYGSRYAGFFLALASIFAWAVSTTSDVDSVVSIWFFVANLCLHLVAYVALAVMMTNFRSVHGVEMIAADRDHLTGLLSTRGFYDRLADETRRGSRYPRTFSLAYIDVDYFKFINDSRGHGVGDMLLVEVAKTLLASLRATDVIARMGGDEFACMMPETDAKDARHVFSGVIQGLSASMRRYHWPVSFSVGMVTFETPPASVVEAIKITDDLMYHVKKSGKNNIEYRIWRGEGRED